MIYNYDNDYNSCNFIIIKILKGEICKEWYYEKTFLDIVGAAIDVGKLIGYYFAGVILVGGPLYLIAKIFEWLF